MLKQKMQIELKTPRKQGFTFHSRRDKTTQEAIKHGKFASKGMHDFIYTNIRMSIVISEICKYHT